MYPAPPSAAVAAVALILVFSSSLAVCCICVRFAGRRRYQPASRDELERAILPRSVSSPELTSDGERQRRQGGGSLNSIGKLTKSIRRRLRRRRELLMLSNDPSQQMTPILATTSVLLNPGSIAIECNKNSSCFDNATYWADSSSGIGSASQGRSSRSSFSLQSSGREFDSSVYSVPVIAAGLLNQQQLAMPAPSGRAAHPLMLHLSEVYTRSRETEL